MRDEGLGTIAPLLVDRMHIPSASTSPGSLSPDPLPAERRPARVPRACPARGGPTLDRHLGAPPRRRPQQAGRTGRPRIPVAAVRRVRPVQPPVLVLGLVCEDCASTTVRGWCGPGGGAPTTSPVGNGVPSTARGAVHEAADRGPRGLFAAAAVPRVLDVLDVRPRRCRHRVVVGGGAGVSGA